MKESVTGSYERERRQQDGGLLFCGPKQRQLVEKLGLNSGRANVVRMLITGELEPEAIKRGIFVEKKLHAVLVAINEVVEGQGIGSLIRGKVAVDFFYTDYFYIVKPRANNCSSNGDTLMYHVVEKRFVIDDVERLIAKAARDTRGRQLTKGNRLEVWNVINIAGIK